MDKKSSFLSAISLIILIVAWYLVTVSGRVNALFLPTPSGFFTALLDNLRSSEFRLDVTMSVIRVLEAFCLSVAVAVPVAAAMASSTTLDRLLAPYIEFIRYLPVPALIPLTILVFGVDESAKIVLLFTGTCFQMIVLVEDDLHNIPFEYRELISSLGIKGFRRQLWMFREILPRLYDHSRVMVGWCWTYVVIAELVAAEHGLGHFVKEAQRLTNTPAMYVGMAAMGFLGLATDWIFKFSYPHIFPYAEPKVGRA